MKLEEIDKARKLQGVSWSKLAEELPINGDSLRIAFKRGSVDPTYLEYVIDYLGLDSDKTDKNNTPPRKNDKQTNLKKVPVYETEVTSSIVSSFSDVPEIPSYYLDFEPFNDCDAVVTNYGDSMYPDYKNGERLAVKKMVNFDILNWGEVFLVITDAEANDLKTVKKVFQHEDKDKIILRASNPRYPGDTIIPKENVLALFAVKGKISQNFL